MSTRVWIDGLTFCAECHAAVDRGWPHDPACSLAKRESTKLNAEKIARAFQVPYWLIGVGPKPSWWRRPIWRLRAWRWSRG